MSTLPRQIPRRSGRKRGGRSQRLSSAPTRSENRTIMPTQRFFSADTTTTTTPCRPSAPHSVPPCPHKRRDSKRKAARSRDQVPLGGPWRVLRCSGIDDSPTVPAPAWWTRLWSPCETGPDLAETPPLWCRESGTNRGTNAGKCLFAYLCHNPGRAPHSKGSIRGFPSLFNRGNPTRLNSTSFPFRSADILRRNSAGERWW